MLRAALESGKVTVVGVNDPFIELDYMVSTVYHKLRKSTDMLTCLYLPVLERKLASSTEVRPYFSKYGHRVSRKYRNRNMNDASLLSAKPIVVR